MTPTQDKQREKEQSGIFCTELLREETGREVAPLAYSEGNGGELPVVVNSVEEDCAGIGQTRLRLSVVQAEGSLSHQRQMHIRWDQQVVLWG